MWKVCVADDEKYVLKSIIQRIEMSGIPFEIAGVAEDGKEALALYESCHPDIFFVDINMPLIDGLDFISRIRFQDPESKTRFVIISGYDDFAYMKKSIQLGVVNYLKKPISMEEFTMVLETLHDQLKKSEKKEQNSSVLQWMDYVKTIRDHCTAGSWICLYGSRIRESAGEILNQWEKKQSGNWIGLTFYGMENVILLYGDTIACSKRDLEEALALGILHPAKQIVYYQGKCENPEKLISAFEDILNLRFYQENSRVTLLEEISIQNSSDEQFPYEKFDSAVESGKKDTIEACAEEMWNYVWKEKNRYPLVKQMYQSLIIIMANKYTKYGITLPGGMRQELFPFSTSAFEKREELAVKVAEYACGVKQEIEERSAKSELTAKVIVYMKQHYQQEISLSDIAGEFYVAPTYLAKRFKEKTNCTVMQYLETIRMEKARELLEKTELSITEVAQAVGYSDPNYFTRIFRQNWEKSPKKFREARRNDG